MADKEFPSPTQFKKMPLSKEIKLERITYKLNDTNHTLVAIQLGFTNGVQSPLFMAKGKGTSLLPENSVKVDTSKSIR